MGSMRKILLAATAAFVASGATALAAPATVTSNVNVRTGPGTSYAVIDQFVAGDEVNVVGCDGAWCEIDLERGNGGYVSAAYLDRGGRVVERSRVYIEEDEPEIITGLSIGGYWESRPYYYRDGYYYYGGRWYGDRPGRGGWERSWRRDHDWRRGRDRGDWRGDRDRPGRGDRPDRDRPGRGDRPDRDRPDRADRPDRGDRPDRTRPVVTGPGMSVPGPGRDRGDRGDGPKADRGDRLGLDRAGGGGGRGDGGGRGGGDRGGDRGGGGGDRGGGGGGGGDRGGGGRGGDLRIP